MIIGLGSESDTSADAVFLIIFPGAAQPAQDMEAYELAQASVSGQAARECMKLSAKHGLLVTIL